MVNHATALALVFGGCCSNALALEELTATQPSTGTLLTFLQFLLVAITGLPNVITFEKNESYSLLPRLRQRVIPLGPYAIQVTLFLLVSRLNNAAFAYSIPMSVHIVFRSGGVIVSLILGRLLLGRRYTTAQVLSVVAVFIGVLLTTFSASSTSSPKPSASPKSQTSGSDSDPHSSSYAKGISLLTIALMLSGLLGNIQDHTFTKYASRSGSGPGPWKEAMFYLHALALPLFLPSLPTLRSQLSTVIFSDPSSYVIQVPTLLTTLVTNKTGAFRFMLPSAVVPLAFTLATSLPCSAGANVLSSSMTSTSVALVLATRKATSLLLSTLVFGSSNVRSPMMMGAGAALVFVGSVGWAGAGVQIKNREKKTKASEKAKAKQE